MRSLSWLIPLALALVSCGGVTSDPQSSDTHAVSGETCSEMGATATAMDGCNTCMCTSDGWACTKEACPPAEELCTEGETTGDGCSSCTCSAGNWVCTASACPDPVDCEPGATKMADDGCNSCTCTDDGTWACTDMACDPSCDPGDTKPTDDGCNTCNCTDSGLWVCTLVDCEEPGDPECPAPQDVPPETGCVDAIAYGRSPDTGACCEYGTPCQVPSGWTSFYSLEECQGADDCEPGATKDDGCNTCSCTDDGSWVCTEKACPEEVGCGGWLGDTCTEGEYCAYEEGQMCGAADASSVCKPRPDGCTLDINPVCGCDFNEYNSACEAASAGTGVLYAGLCKTTD